MTSKLFFTKLKNVAFEGVLYFHGDSIGIAEFIDGGLVFT
jgi:hypothetical protein